MMWRRFLKPGRLVWILGYLATMTLIVVAMIDLRGRQLESGGSRQAKDDWQQWRRDVDRQSAESGPVKRRIPESSEPPLYVLLTEHFSVLLFFSLIFGSVFYFMLYFFTSATFSSQTISGRADLDDTSLDDERNQTCAKK